MCIESISVAVPVRNEDADRFESRNLHRFALPVTAGECRFGA
jgi:hypothetical protein